MMRIIKIGKKQSKETKYKISIAQKGKPRPNNVTEFTEDWKNNISKYHADFNREKNPMFGKNHSNDSKKKIIESLLKQPKIKCPFCNKNGVGGAMYRWHFDKCKFKGEKYVKS